MATAPPRLVVLDDDPTGIQTVHGCCLLTEWSPATLRAALTDRAPFFYVLTHTRAVDRERARRIAGEVVANVLQANTDLGCPLVFVSRGLTPGAATFCSRRRLSRGPGACPVRYGTPARQHYGHTRGRFKVAERGGWHRVNQRFAAGINRERQKQSSYIINRLP